MRSSPVKRERRGVRAKWRSLSFDQRQRDRGVLGSNMEPRKRHHRGNLPNRRNETPSVPTSHQPPAEQNIRSRGSHMLTKIDNRRREAIGSADSPDCSRFGTAVAMTTRMACFTPGGEPRDASAALIRRRLFNRAVHRAALTYHLGRNRRSPLQRKGCPTALAAADSTALLAAAS